MIQRASSERVLALLLRRRMTPLIGCLPALFCASFICLLLSELSLPRGVAPVPSGKQVGRSSGRGAMGVRPTRTPSGPGRWRSSTSRLQRVVMFERVLMYIYPYLPPYTSSLTSHHSTALHLFTPSLHHYITPSLHQHINTSTHISNTFPQEPRPRSVCFPPQIPLPTRRLLRRRTKTPPPSTPLHVHHGRHW